MLADLLYIAANVASCLIFALLARGILMYAIAAVMFMFAMSHTFAFMALTGTVLICLWSAIKFVAKAASRYIRFAFGPVVGQPITL